MMVTKEYLNEHPEKIFVFGDNLTRRGHAGASALRECPNSYGFITKKYPSNDDHAFYSIDEYAPVFRKEMEKLETFIQENPDKEFLISKLGSGLANKYLIFENIIYDELLELEKKYDNVNLLFQEFIWNKWQHT